MLTHERLRQLVDYDPETGLFARRTDSSNRRFKAGENTGSSTGRFVSIWLDGKPYLAHRIAWFWMPDRQIDHRNLDGNDNRWSNLRLATASQNGMNRRAGRGASGLKGVHFIANTEKCGSKPWRARITKDGRHHFLGLFATREEAKAAYDAAAQRIHGEFARLA